MAWGHVNYQPFALPLSHSLERFGHNLVVAPTYKARPRFIHKIYEPSLCFFAVLQLFQVGKLSQQLFLLRLSQ